VLQDQPHAFDVIPGIAPVAERGEVTEEEFLLFPLGDPRRGQGDLPGDEGFSAALGLVIEEDAGAAEHVVGFTVFLGDPEAILLGDGVGAIGMERGCLRLRHFLDLAVELGR